MTQNTTPPIQVHPLIDFADRWQLDGDYLRCRRCKRPQQVWWSLHDFPHAPYCPVQDGERNPWKSLAGLITAEIAGAKEPPPREFPWLELYTAGVKADLDKQPRVPPEGLTEQQRETWLSGYDR